jgi:hypothetical protein
MDDDIRQRYRMPPRGNSADAPARPMFPGVHRPIQPAAPRPQVPKQHRSDPHRPAPASHHVPAARSEHYARPQSKPKSKLTLSSPCFILINCPLAMLSIKTHSTMPTAKLFTTRITAPTKSFLPSKRRRPG